MQQDPDDLVTEARADLILADGVSTVYSFGSGFVVPGAETVYVSGLQIDTADYVIDHNTNSVVFWHRPEKWALLRVTYRCVRFPGQPEAYRLRRLPSALRSQPDSESSAVVAVEPESRTADSSGLALSGSKTLGVSLGSGDAGLDQATRVAITGRVEDVEVEAELSDQSSPIPPEGTTRDIEELDKLLVSLRAKRWRGSFGDVGLRLPAGGFGAIARDAVGATVVWGEAQGETGLGPVVQGGYASPKGLFGRVELAGVDGSQGPYVLAPDGRAAQIVPGSEEVHLNGDRMTRGWDADYTIDYSTGELVFTNRRLIDRRSRIEATFQYVTGDYRRAIVVGGADYRRQDARFNLGLFREDDDPTQNYTEDLTASEKESLAAIGADTARAWLDGATYAGEGKGDYVKSGDHFVYVGRDSGDYQVRFTLVGDSLGDYRYNDTTLAYSFAGPRRGNYVAKRRVALPQRSEAAYARIGVEQSGFAAGLEGLLQRQRLNLFAPSGAATDAGALELLAGWQDSLYGVTYKHRLQGPGLELKGAAPAVDYSYRWAGATDAERRSSDEVAVRARPISFLNLGGEAGRLDRFSASPIERYQARLSLPWLGYDVTRVAEITRQNLLLTPRAGRFHPKAGWQSETRSDQKSSTWTAGLELTWKGSGGQGIKDSNPGTGILESSSSRSLLLGIDYRQTGYYEPDSVTGIWPRTTRARVLEARLDWTRGSAYRLSAIAGLNDRRYDGGSGFPSATAEEEPDWRQLLASLSGSASPGAGLRLQSDFSQSYRQVQLRDEVFRYVGPNQGDYRRDSLTGRYVRDARGDYKRVVVPTGRLARAREWSWNGSGEMTSFEPAVLSGSFSQNRTSTDAAVLSELSRQDLRLVLKSLEPIATPTLGAGSDFSQDRTLVATGQARSRQHAYLELYSDRIPEVEVRFRIEPSRSRRRLSTGEADYDERSWQVQAGPVIGRRLRLELELGYEYKSIAEPLSYPELGRFSLTTQQVGLARAFSFAGRTRVRGSAGLTRRTATVRTLPFDLSLDQPLGMTPTAGLNLEHSFSQVLSASARYGYLDRPDRAAEHQLNAELKASF